MLAVWFVMVFLFRLVKADERPTGYLFYTSDVINLDLNQTSYIVGCTVNSTGGVGTDMNIQNLMILDARRNPYLTEIVNDTTIIHKVDLRNGDESTLCGVRSYICRLNRSLIAMRSIYVARPPPAIKPADFKCISYNRKRLVCQFQRDNSCGLYTEYNLSMIRLSSQSVCNLTDNGTMLSFDSSSDTCVFSSGHRTLTFRIEGTNKIGKTESTHLVDHFDIVRPEEPSDLDVSFLDITSVNLTWSMSFLLYNLNRSFEVEFHLITKHGVIQTFVNLSLSKDKKIMHHFEDLYAFTSYELRMRVRVIPKSERNFEEDYWSEWSSIEFQTKPCKPYEAPRILSGAYSFKERRENLVTIEVYWEQIPEHRYNGPGFGYGIYALSQSGQKLSTNGSNNGVATFQKTKVDEQYTVYLYSYNEEGRSDNTNIIHIYPHEFKYQPKIKRMLYNESYQLQWFPADEMENLSNYTIMYCSYSTTGTCHGSIKFDTLPADATSYFLNMTKPLTFALAANYHTYSSELTWPLCTISPATSISQISFKLTDITEQSFTLRLQLSCMDQSLIDRYDVRYWPTLKRDAMRNQTFRPYDTVIPIENLVIDTEYEVIVTAYDDRGNTFEASSSVRTKDKDILMQLALFLLFGMLVMGFITTTATRKVKKIMNIKVEIPSGLLGIYETPIQLNSFQEESEFQPISEGLELEELSNGENHQFVKKQNHCFPSNWEQSNQSPSQLPFDGMPVQVNTVQEKCRPENFINAIEMEELSPSEEKPFLKVKSILKKPEQICPPNHSEKPKPTVQIVTGDNYIKPSQMPCMMDPTEVMPPIARENSPSGYVDVKLMRNQHRV